MMKASVYRIGANVDVTQMIGSQVDGCTHGIR